MFDAIVIGGGQAGLAASHHLGRRGIDHVVLERGRIGESWRSQRWDSFALNTPNWMNRLPGEAEDVEPRDGFLSRDAYVTRLQAYADDSRLPVRTETTVVRVAPNATGGSFVVSTDGDRGAELEARCIVVASGIQRVPKIPAFAASLPGSVRQVHVADYRNPRGLPPGAVLVVGSAQSGVQVTEDLLDAGRTVYLCTSAVARLRRRYRGRDTLAWLLKGGFLDQTLERLPDPRLQFAPLPITSGVGRYGHTVSLQWLAARGAILLGRPVAVESDRLLLEDTLAANVAFGDRMSAEFNAAVEKGIREAGIEPPALEPDPADTPHHDPTSPPRRSAA